MALAWQYAIKLVTGTKHKTSAAAAADAVEGAPSVRRGGGAALEGEVKEMLEAAKAAAETARLATLACPGQGWPSRFWQTSMSYCSKFHENPLSTLGSPVQVSPPEPRQHS